MNRILRFFYGEDIELGPFDGGKDGVAFGLVALAALGLVVTGTR